MADTVTPPTFEAPGPGGWTLDTGHFPRPVTAFTAQVYTGPAMTGFAAATRAYGLLLDTIEWRFVDGWGYLCPRPVAPLARADRDTPAAWDRLVGTHPALARRLETSATVFQRRPWRDELAQWHQQVRPRLIAAQGRLQAQDPATVTTDGLLAHLDRAHANLQNAIELHHRFGVTPVVAVGDLLVHGHQWTGAPSSRLLGLVATTDRVAAVSAPLLRGVADAIRREAPAAQALSQPDAGEALAQLRAGPQAVREATHAYLQTVGHWASGSGNDICEPTLGELPGLLLEQIRAHVGTPAGSWAVQGGTAPARAVRSQVPASRREHFDRLLAEARAVHGLRHERAIFTDVWANGLMRRAVLAAGARLVDRGRLDRPAQLLEATFADMRSLLATGQGPSAGQLADRAAARDAARVHQAPATLGGPARGPVPVDWLAPDVARTERAFRAYLAAMADAEAPASAAPELRGQGASGGVQQGPARIVAEPGQLGRVRHGEILVAGSVTPAFDAVFSLVGAIVAERGGILSHAAIVAREHAIPAVVGVAGATGRIRTGDIVRVDGDAGTVTVLD